MVTITLDPGLGARLRRALNSPHRRRSGLNENPAVACTFPLGATSTERARASHEVPKSIAAQPPPA
jgi:hypothetical protein